MKLEKIINVIGYVLLVPAPIALFWILGIMARNGYNKQDATLAAISFVVTVIGLIMGNFKKEWIMVDDDEIC